MAHTLKRIEGFELGTHLNIDGDANVGGVTFPTSGQLSGNYYCKITNDGVTAGFIRLALAFDADGTPSTTQLFAAAAFRIGFKVEAYPDTNGRVVFVLEGAAGAIRSSCTMSTTGVLTLDGIAGATALALGTWVDLYILYDSASTGSVSMRIATSTGVVQEFSGVTPTANGTLLRLMMGKTTNAGTHTIGVDDIAIEAAAAVASIDYPSPGSVIGMALDGNGAGFLNSYSWAIGGSSPPATRWEASNKPHDGNVSHIGISGVGTRKQTFTLETPTGVGDIINGVLFCQTARNTGACSVKMLAGSSNFTTVGAGAVTSITALASPTAGTAFHFQASMRQTNPFTLAAWAIADLPGLVIGVHSAPGGGSVYRHTTSAIMVDSQEAPGSTVNSTLLQEALYPRGVLRSVTNYTPELRTVRITSEAYGVPNEAFNIVAVSIRHVPSGVGVVQGTWNFDQNATGSFTLANNPLNMAIMHDDAASSSFILDGDSEMVDGQQVYTEYIPIQDSGKIFELSLTQEGDRCMEILAIDVEIQPEGRKPAYLREQF